jgi:hypothetical protein
MNFEKLIEESKNKDLKSIKEEVSQIMLDKKYSTDIFTNYTFNGFYRARVHDNIEGYYKKGILNKFINEKEFWNSPIEYASMGRCNDKWESIFYCASDFITAVLEVKPKVGDYITVSNFQNFYTNNVPQFRINAIGKAYLSKIPHLKDLFEGYILMEDQLEMDSFLDKLFHQNVGSDELYKYKLSVAVSHIFMTDGTNIRRDVLQTDGLLYPSIIRNQKSYCFGLKPWWVHCYFEIKSIQTIQILEIGNDFIKLKLLRNGDIMGNKLYPNDLFDVYWSDAPENTLEFEIVNFD